MFNLHFLSKNVFIFFFINVLTFSPKAQNVDIELLKRIHSPQSVPSDNFWRGYSNSVVPFSIALPLGVGVASLLEKDKEQCQKLRLKTVELGTAWALNVGLTYLLKKTTNRERPFVAYPQDFTAKMDESTSSFPSGHSSVAFQTATSLSLYVRKWYVIVPAYAWACGMGYSRWHLGVHYPSDVAAGAILGIGSAWTTYRLNKWLTKKYK
jgi:undecaprenyl-diphosphatase